MCLGLVIVLLAPATNPSPEKKDRAVESGPCGLSTAPRALNEGDGVQAVRSD